MKPILTVELRVRSTDDPSKYEHFQTLEVPGPGHLTVLIDRADDGRLVVDESTLSRADDWIIKTELLDSAMAALNGTLAKAGNDISYVVQKLYDLKHYLERGK